MTAPDADEREWVMPELDQTIYSLGKEVDRLRTALEQADGGREFWKESHKKVCQALEQAERQRDGWKLKVCEWQDLHTEMEKQRDEARGLLRWLLNEIRAEREDRVALARWENQWPNACDECHGWGGFSYTDNHGIPGPGEHMFDVCDCCAGEQPVCPRCGAAQDEEWVEADNPTCASCGWQMQHPDGRPEPYDGMGMMEAEEQAAAHLRGGGD